jgi:hypothetical protein
VKWGTLQMTLALATQSNWELFHLDVKTSFLNGELQEKVYMTQREGFLIASKKNKVCHFKNFFYDLRQTPFAWYSKIDEHLKEQGLHLNSVNYNLYYYLEDD